MANKKIILGMDRYIAREWADFGMELRIRGGNHEDQISQLREYLIRENLDPTTTRKTISQLVRLWINDPDEQSDLRDLVAESCHDQFPQEPRIFHLGMALNVFPIFREACIKIGILSRVQGHFSRQTLSSRVVETYGNTASTQRKVRYVVQTLVDWGFISDEDGRLSQVDIRIHDQFTASWLIMALIKSRQTRELPMHLIADSPEKIGVVMPDIRDVVSISEILKIDRMNHGDYVKIVFNDIN